jgi:hypothetical protein
MRYFFSAQRGEIMQISSALSNALHGIQKGLTGMDKNAAKIASVEAFNSQNPADVAQPLVDMQNNRLQVEASAKVMKTVDATIGSLIDVVA